MHDFSIQPVEEVIAPMDDGQLGLVTGVAAGAYVSLGFWVFVLILT